MTPELLTRMGRWLAFLEPEHFKMRFGYLEDGNLSKIFINPKNEVDQDRLFGACFRAATARGWYPLVESNGLQTRATILKPKASIEGTEFEKFEFGLSMAACLIEAHGVQDWESRDPTFPEETT